MKAERRDKRKRSFPVWLCRGASYLRRSQRYEKPSAETNENGVFRFGYAEAHPRILSKTKSKIREKRANGAAGRRDFATKRMRGPERGGSTPGQRPQAKGRMPRTRPEQGKEPDRAIGRSGPQRSKKSSKGSESCSESHVAAFCSIHMFIPPRTTYRPSFKVLSGVARSPLFYFSIKNDGYLKIFVIFEHLERHEFLKYERKCRFI